MFVQLWFCPSGESRKGLSDACLSAHAPALCHAPDNISVFSTVCFLFSPDQMWLMEELEKATMLCWEPLDLSSGRTATGLQLQACPFCVLVPVLNVVFSKNNLWVLAEQVNSFIGVSEQVNSFTGVCFPIWKTFSYHRLQTGTVPKC